MRIANIMEKLIKLIDQKKAKARKSLEIVEAIYCSANTKREIFLPL